MDMTIVLIVAAGVAVILLIVGLVVSLSSERSVVEERLGRYVEQERPVEKDKSDPHHPDVTDWINERVTGSSFGDNTRSRAGQSRSQTETWRIYRHHGHRRLLVLATHFISWAGATFCSLWLVVRLGLFLPGFTSAASSNRRLIRFNEQLSDMLNLMVNGLRAGYSTMQAMEAVSKELPPPICDEFSRVVQEMQLGVPMQQALDNLLRRIPSEDLDLVITAINVQREVGGNLAEILDTISYTIRERVRIKGEIRVLTTQVMYSGRFLSMMPLFVMGILFLLNRPYMMEFFNPAQQCQTSLRVYCPGLRGLLIISGYVAMNKIADIEV